MKNKLGQFSLQPSGHYSFITYPVYCYKYQVTLISEKILLKNLYASFLHRLLVAFLWLHQKNALRLQHNVFHLIFSRNICRERTVIVSVLLMELKSIASKWKNNIILISLVMAILYNGREVLLVVPLLLNEKKMLLFYGWFSTLEKNKEAEWSEKSLKHMYVLFPFFGLN